jgi:DNA-binding beta-propeller fold protein YncE
VIDPHVHIVVLDTLWNRVAAYSRSGMPLRERAETGFGTGDLAHPTAIGVDGRGNIVVLDAAADRVESFSPSGRLVRSWSVDPYGQTSIRGDMAVNSRGDVHLGIDNRILELSPQGLPIRSWGSVGTGPGRFLKIRGIAVDGKGDVVATDAEQNRLQIFSSSGKLLASWMGLGPKGPRFTGLGALAVDDHADIFVLNGAQLVKLAPLLSL